MPSAPLPIWLIITSILLVQETPEPVVVQQAANWTSVIMTLAAGLPATIAAIMGGMALLQSRRNAEVAAATGAAVATNIEKTDAVDKKATEIHTLTNSNLTKVQAQLEVANERIEGFHKAQAESVREIANMRQMITSLIPAKDQQASSQGNSEKLDSLKSMLTDVQQGTPPIPVKDEAVLKKLEEVTVITDKKLDTLQESADVAKEKAGES